MKDPSSQPIAGLTQRLPYAGEVMSIQWVGLQADRSLRQYCPPPGPTLILVAFGQVRLERLGHSLLLKEARCHAQFTDLAWG